MHAVRAVRAEHDRLVDVGGAGRPRHEIDRAWKLPEPVSRKRPCVLHVRHDPARGNHRDVRFRQEAHGGRRVRAGSEDERSRLGDRGCTATLKRYEERLARALASVINLLDPEVIVLGGGLSRIERLVRNVPARWSSHVYSDTVVTRLVKAAHGDASGVRGAARLW